MTFPHLLSRRRVAVWPWSISSLPVLLVGLLLLGACQSEQVPQPPPTPRRSVVWVADEDIDLETALHLEQAGVDELVLQRGSVRLSGDVPVPMLSPSRPMIEGNIPLALALKVERARPDLDPAQARVLWRTLAEDIGDRTVQELILDLPQVPAGFADFLRRLSRESGLPVLPLLLPEQLSRAEVMEAVVAANGCIVAVYGNLSVLRSGAEQLDEPLAQQLQPLQNLGVRVRVAVVLDPISEPVMEARVEDINAITEDQIADISTDTSFDRAFRFRTAATWSGRDWNPRDQVAVRWLDCVRLSTAFGEMGRLRLPELGGWDLISLPPPQPGILGLTREALWRYLTGEGPSPELEIATEKAYGSFRVFLRNNSPFTSTVSSFGNWLEVSAENSHLVADGPGSFNRVMRGNRRGSDWQATEFGNVSSIRFVENYIGPFEELQTDWIRLVSSRAQVVIRWQMVMSNGEEITSAPMQLGSTR